ncbi:MAG: hypothetical protein KC994_13590 [Candidatus Omnitrophica bacterium]|nr:hypothetical protein [Candidatus Omnitrophota bacterium]
MNSPRSIFHQWLWEPAPLAIFVTFFLVAPAGLTLGLFPRLGAYSLFCLFSMLIGFGSWITYGIVGKKVRALERELATEENHPVQGLIVNGFIQSPGVILLGENKIALHPIVGDPVTVPLDEIQSFRERNYFNGSLLIFKTGFRLIVPTHKRLGFAIPKSHAGPFRLALWEAQKENQEKR